MNSEKWEKQSKGKYCKRKVAITFPIIDDPEHSNLLANILVPTLSQPSVQCVLTQPLTFISPSFFPLYGYKAAQGQDRFNKGRQETGLGLAVQGQERKEVAALGHSHSFPFFKSNKKLSDCITIRKGAHLPSVVSFLPRSH